MVSRKKKIGVCARYGKHSTIKANRFVRFVRHMNTRTMHTSNEFITDFSYVHSLCGGDLCAGLNSIRPLSVYFLLLLLLYTQYRQLLSAHAHMDKEPKY